MKINKAIAAFVIPLVSAVLLTPVNAGTPAKRGSEGKGRHYFRETCKGCHTKGAKGGEMSPLSKTQAQWKAYFAKGKHADATEELTKFFSPEQMLDVQTFLVNHAADSLQPETCGK